MFVRSSVARVLVGVAALLMWIGATLGGAGVGAVFTHRLADQLDDRLTARAARTVGETDSLTPALVHSLPDKVQDTVILAYQHALTPVFRHMVPVYVLGLVLAFLPPEKKLAGGNAPGSRPGGALRGRTGPRSSAATAPVGGLSRSAGSRWAPTARRTTP